MPSELRTVLDITKYVNLVRDLDDSDEVNELDGLTDESHDGNVLIVMIKMAQEGASASTALNDIKQFLKFVA